MSANDVVDAVLRLLEIISAWPVILLLTLLLFRRPIGEFTNKYAPELLSRITSAKVPGGIELGFAEAAEVVSDTLQEVVNKGAEEYQDNPQEFAAFVVEQASKLPMIAASPGGQPDLQGRHILWVDDKPANNVVERNIMERLGAVITLATSTAEALKKIRQGRYDVIISDLGRIEGARFAKEAGYELLDKLRDRLNITTPFFIYTGSNPPEQIAEAKRRGAFGCTDSPQELLQLVGRAGQNTPDA
jgi:CheY-like chemotaxis protein